MGRTLVAEIQEDPELELAGALEAPQSPFIGVDAGALAGGDPCGVKITADIEEALKNADCLIDFTAAAVTRHYAPIAAAKGVSLVIGSTGLTDEDLRMLRRLADDGARIVQSPNMSVEIGRAHV